MNSQGARVILTSRRREQIEALPVQTENWLDTEGAEFLRKRGTVLRCAAIQQAGDSTLKKYSKLLVNKPIALEVFVQAAAAPGVGLDTHFSVCNECNAKTWGSSCMTMRGRVSLLSCVAYFC